MKQYKFFSKKVCKNGCGAKNWRFFHHFGLPSFYQNYLLLSQTCLKAAFATLSFPILTLTLAPKGLVSQTKRLIYQTWQSVDLIAKSPQEAFLCI